MGTIGYLLDTCTFLWAIRESHKLSVTAKEMMDNFAHNCFVSSVSAYEIMNKHRLGKLPEYSSLARNYLSILNRFGANKLPIKTEHAHYAGKMEWEHRDPFDRLLAAQAFSENLTLITNDTAFNSLHWLNILW